MSRRGQFARTLRAWTLLALVALALPASASTFLSLSRQELATQAGAVVEARVTGVRSFWNPERTVIVTEARLVVDDLVTGDAARELVVKTFGGTVNGYTVVAHGFPTFHPGERQLLYLVQEPLDGSVRVLGYQQGQYRIVTGDDGVDKAIPAVGEGARFLTGDGRPVPAAQVLPLAELKQQIRNEARVAGRPAV